MRPYQPHKYEIHWEDICTMSGWKHPNKCSTMYAVAVGYLIEKTKKHIKLASMVSDDGQTADITTFPIGCVRKMKRVK